MAKPTRAKKKSAAKKKTSSPKPAAKKSAAKKSAAKKTAAKKSAAKKPAAKKPAAKKPAAKKTASKKKTAAKKTASKKTAAKKPASKKPASKKPAAKKTASKKPASKKTAAKKTAAKKTAANKPAAKKTAAAKKPVSKKPVSKKPAAADKKPVSKKSDSSATQRELAPTASKSGRPRPAPKAAPTEVPSGLEAQNAAEPNESAANDGDTKPAPGPGQTAKLRVGDPAPAFALEASDGKTYSLEGLKGQRFVLYFYPRDNTPGCTQEACDFRDQLDELGVQVFGVSGDSLKSHGRFADKYDLNFPLLSDPDRAIAEAYGALGEKSMYGRTVVGIIRSTFVIDAQGRVETVFSPVRVKGHVATVAQALGAN